MPCRAAEQVISTAWCETRQPGSSPIRAAQRWCSGTPSESVTAASRNAAEPLAQGCRRIRIRCRTPLGRGVLSSAGIGLVIPCPHGRRARLPPQAHRPSRGNAPSPRRQSQPTCRTTRPSSAMVATTVRGSSASGDDIRAGSATHSATGSWATGWRRGQTSAVRPGSTSPRTKSSERPADAPVEPMTCRLAGAAPHPERVLRPCGRTCPENNPLRTFRNSDLGREPSTWSRPTPRQDKRISLARYATKNTSCNIYATCRQCRSPLGVLKFLPGVAVLTQD